MSKQKYIVEIEMPDGDFISHGYLKEVIQSDCDYDSKKGDYSVSVREYKDLPDELDKASAKYAEENTWVDEFTPAEECEEYERHTAEVFVSGAEWMLNHIRKHRISENRGVIVGLRAVSNADPEFIVEIPGICDDKIDITTIGIMFNVNRPEAFNIEDYMSRRIRTYVEIEDKQ